MRDIVGSTIKKVKQIAGWRQDGYNIAQDGAKMTPDEPKMTQNEPKMAPRWSQDAPKIGLGCPRGGAADRVPKKTVLVRKYLSRWLQKWTPK